MKAPPPWVSVIIVNYNAGAFLQKAIDKVAAQTDTQYELILLDNASTDGSIDTLKTDHITNFKLVKLSENIGFAAGNNLAAREASGQWLALLNPDTEAKPDWLAEFKNATLVHPRIKMFAGATINTSNPDILDGAGDCYHFLGVPWRGGYNRPVSELPGIGECFSACGASALIHRETFLNIGGFDESFFCYCEDVDLGFRLRLEGGRCLFWPRAAIYHYGSGTTSVASPFSVRHGTRNRLWTFVKNMPPIALIILFPLHLLLSFAFIARAFMKGRGKPTLLGFIDGLKGLPAVWRTRKQIQARRKLNSWQICRQMSWNMWLMLTRRSDVRPLD
jgi:GT2 family glycosyltransferase